MKLDQFDKLQKLVGRLEERTMYLRQQNFRLLQENSRLKKELENLAEGGISPQYEEQLKRLIEENRKLKETNNRANVKLNALIDQVGQALAEKNGVGKKIEA
ncbi:MAG TPA: hypothetical protein ENJ15_03705 [Caldithrix abyssi]|uniref:Cell division protein ZapB n=1 Tax=Caldithrix abyssi TaxID=187145 RepID=A0A7V5VEW2_CALAY|nr:hypothetical protein [Caldithrix abyssi]